MYVRDHESWSEAVRRSDSRRRRHRKRTPRLRWGEQVYVQKRPPKDDDGQAFDSMFVPWYQVHPTGRIWSCLHDVPFSGMVLTPISIWQGQ